MLNGLILSLVVSQSSFCQDSVTPLAPVTDGGSLLPSESPLTTHHSETVSCGVGAAFLLLQRLGEELTIEEIEAASPVAADAPMSLADLQTLFANLGYPAEGLRMPLDRVDRPLIAYLPHPKERVGHFVVVEPVGEQGSEFGVQGSGNPRSSVESASGSPPSALRSQLFLILDPLASPIKVPAERLSKGWDGRVLLVYAKGTQLPRRATSALNSWPLTIGVAVCAALFAVVAPFFVRQLRYARTARKSQSAPEYAASSLCQSVASSHREQAAKTGTGTSKTRSQSRFSDKLLTSRRFIRIIWSGATVAVCIGVSVLWMRSRPSSANDPKSGDFRYEVKAPVRIEVPDWGTVMQLKEGTNFDLGQVKLGEKLSHTFQVKNVGKRDLPLEKLKMNCACNAQVSYERDVCRPGETAGVKLSMTAAGYGSQTKPIPFAIVRDGELHNLFTLNLNYRVAWIQQLTFLPGHLELGQLSCTAESAKREVQLVLVGPPDEPDPELLDVTSDTTAIAVNVVRREIPEVNARTAQMIPAKRVIYWLELEVHPLDLALGLFHEHVTASTSIGEAKLGIKGEICRPITAIPASLLVDASRPQAMQYVIRFKSVAGERVQIRSAKCESSGVICRADSDRQQVTVEIAAEARLDREAAVEIVAQAGESVQTLRVPLVEF